MSKLQTNSQAVPPPNQFWNGTTAICAYCRAPAKLTDFGGERYPYRKDFGLLWVCPRCPDTFVGCHPNTVLPLGRTANKELREAKKAAHEAFDPLWRGKIAIEGCRPHKARKLGYTWLAGRLGIHVDQCHIGWFDIDQCQRVVDVCTPYLRKVA
ncbi:zinc-finger-containing protein [Pusillimonas sp. SM2304]|uniref:zinc-finger-containing protein n=1 Tax=Pusillimonas sp. SM2304 TaxID=3073241 RepID=UPI002874348D|nr:zinc-finger-containing protein [Pusillimonas sp. SM2304]MDS1141756.1 zinc-finger-containing protein [Pusillimonas sp. SM2304]